MSFSIKQFITGIGLKPVSADPSNPTQGQLQYADGTVRAEGLWRYDGSAWQQVGSGAGSYDIFFQENLETNSASNFTTGQAASPDAVGTGTLGGTLANETSSQISGDRSLKYTMNATASSSNNDFIINDTDIALDAKQKGNFIGISFYYTYTGADDDIRFFVLDQDDNEITQSDEYIKANTNPTRFSTSVFIPSSDTALRYGFQVVTGNSSKVFIVDDIEFSTNPFVYKKLLNIEEMKSYTPTTSGFGTISSDSVFYGRMGDMLIVQGEFTTGTVAASEAQIGLPAGLTIDSTKVPTVRIVGSFTTASNSTNVVKNFGILATGGDSYFNIAQRNYHSNQSPLSPQNGNSEIASSQKVSFYATVPITGWTATSEHVVTPAKATNEFYEVDFTTNFWDSTGDTYNLDTTLIPLTNSQLLEWNDTTETRLVAKKDVILSVVTRASITADQNFLIYKSNGDIISNVVSRTDATTTVSTGATVKLLAGDYIYFRKVISSNRDGSMRITALAANAEFLAAVPTQLTAIIEDVKADTVGGGTFTSGAWQTRDLNTLSGDSTFVSLSSNEFTLPSGKYTIDWSATAYDCGYHKSRLYDVTNAAVEKYGSTLDTEVSANVCNKSEGNHVLTITSSTTYRIEHKCSTTKSTTGFGPAVSLGGDNIFCSVKITKIK